MFLNLLKTENKWKVLIFALLLIPVLCWVQSSACLVSPDFTYKTLSQHLLTAAESTAANPRLSLKLHKIAYYDL